MPKSSLRIIGYVSRDEIPARMKMAADVGWLETDKGDILVRFAFSSEKLRGSEPQEIASLVVALVGVDEVAGRQVFFQPEPRFYEMSVTLIEESNRPDFVLASEPVSVRQAVVDFVSGMR